MLTSHKLWRVAPTVMPMASSAFGAFAMAMARPTTLRPVRKTMVRSNKPFGSPKRCEKVAKVRATELDGASLDSTLVEVTSEISAGDRIISVLFTAAVIGLLVITVGAIYLAVADAQDRKNEEAEKASPGVAKLKQKKKRAGSGGKGFGRD